MNTFFVYHEERNLYDGKKFFSVVIKREYFHKDYFKHHKKEWKEKYGKKVSYSNDQRLSQIKNMLPSMTINSDKAMLYNNLRGKSYLPPFLNFTIGDENWYKNIIRPFMSYDGELWFLKKAGVDLSYGGYDIYPLLARKRTFKSRLFSSIEESNKVKKYKSEIFTLQKGISNPYLTDDGRKFDLRTYGMIVWNNGMKSFYYYDSALMRKNPNKYDPFSENREIQLTNTTFNQNFGDVSSLTELVTKNHPYWSLFFLKTKDIFMDLCHHLSSEGNLEIPAEGKGYHLIGLDFIADNARNMFLLEINSQPAIYYGDDERIDSIHKGMERTLFSEKNFFSLTFDAFSKNRLIKKDTPNFYYCGEN